MSAENSDIDPNLNLNNNNPSIEERTTEKKRDAVINLINDVQAQREDIDKLNNSVTYIAEKLTLIAQTVDKQTAVLNQLVQGGAVAAPGQKGGLDLDKITAIGDILEKAGQVYKSIKGDSNGPPPLIDQTLINEKMKQTFMDNLETGESINNFIKNSLKKSVTKNIINTSLSEIGRGSEEHGPS